MPAFASSQSHTVQAVALPPNPSLSRSLSQHRHVSLTAPGVPKSLPGRVRGSVDPHQLAATSLSVASGEPRSGSRDAE